ncbi:MAG TPA: hypothetical protein VEB70_10200 [Noviherbaspirillum sp.]|nr:hypothetical protein [Noviherbaspirillum sp.]
MNELALRSANTVPHRILGGHALTLPGTGKVERLPFTIRIVQTESELLKAIRVRHTAYARHLPELGEALKEPEAMDFDADVTILLAESKLDGSPLGTARIQTNAFRPLSVERSVDLPAHMQGHRLAEVTRLGVETGRIGRVVKIALVKASFMFCERSGIEWAIAAGRAPIDQQYEALLFSDVYPDQGFVPLQHAGNIPHRVMAFEIGTGHARWSAACHPLLDFFSNTEHPDISVDRREPLPMAATGANDMTFASFSLAQ